MKYLQEAEFYHLLAFCERTNSLHALLIELLARTGMRTDEMLKLKASDFLVREAKIRVSGSKGSYDRLVSVDHAFIARFSFVVLSRMSQEKPLLAYLISKVRKPKAPHRVVRLIWARTREACFGNTVSLGVHCLRHTYGVIGHKALGCDATKTQVLMGHKSLNSTASYVRIAKEEELQCSMVSAISGILDPNKKAS